jgi:transposase
VSGAGRFQEVDLRPLRAGRASAGTGPFSSVLYVFINRQHNKIKVLYWHRNGFCLWLKRLEAEKFAWPQGTEAATQTINLQQFEWLLEGFDLWRNSPHKTLHFTSVS